MDLTPVPVVEGFVRQVHELLMIKSDDSLLALVLVVDSEALERLAGHPRLGLDLSSRLLFFFVLLNPLIEEHAEPGNPALRCDVVRHVLIVFVLGLVVALVV